MKSFTLFFFCILLFAMVPSTGIAQNVTLTSSPVAASNITQGSNNNIVYIVRMDVATLPVTVNSIQFTLTGTHDNNDLTTVNVFYNASAPSLTGAAQAASVSAAFAAPHAYSTSFNFSGDITIPAGLTRYFIIVVSTSPSATHGNTIKVDGAANPVTFGYTTAPNITNNQTDIAGTQTIQAADVTLTSSPVAASSITQGSNNNIVYIVRMDVATLPVTVNSIQFTLTGTHDNNDLTTVNVFYNASAPSLTGATQAASVSAAFAAPHAYSTSFNFSGDITIPAGSTRYFIIVVSTSPSATHGNTVKVNGAANPVTFGYTTAPNITNNQTDIAGTQTIQAADVTLTSSPVAASNITQGSNNNIVYIVRMDVATLPVTVNSIQFTLTGTHDNNDLTTVNVFYNASAPSLTGAAQAASVSAAFAAPHAYSTSFNFSGDITIPAGSTRYFIIVVSTSPSATHGNAIKVDGAANPVTFGFTTAPNITNNQTDIAGTQTIQAADVTLTSSPVAASNITQGSNNNIVYIVRMDVATLPVTVNSIQFTLTGTHDNNDLTTVNVFYNASAPSLTGATQAASVSAAFAAPHAYSTSFNFSGDITIPAGSTRYFIIVVSTSPSATHGNTIKVDGAANPVTFGYTTAPNITNNQTDIAGTQTIQAADVTLTSSPVAASNITQGSNNNIVYIVRMDVATLPVTVNSIQFTLTGTHDNNDLTTVNVFYNASAPSLTGATQAASVSAAFAAPHAYSTSFNFSGDITIPAGSTRYFIIVVSTSPSATHGNTIKVDGAANPVTFGFTTAPNITNNQTDIAGTQTIQAADVTLTSSPVAASSITQGSNNNIVYIARMDVATLPVIVNSIQFTLTGTHDNNDLTTVNVFYNASAPSLTGATQAASVSAAFAAPHAYSTSFNFSGDITIPAGSTRYFIIAVNTSPSATLGNTVKVNGAANPVTFGFTTAPNITNNQTDAAGTQTIGSPPLPLTLISFTGNSTSAMEAKLQWLTSIEINTKDFEIEWSFDGFTFRKIAVLQAAGNSTQNKSYTYLHKLPVAGDNYYRLKMMDIDSRFTYSPIIKIHIKISSPSITVFPNPVIDVLHLHIQAVKTEAMVLTLNNAEGKMIESKSFEVTTGSNRLNWNLQKLTAGNYYLSSGKINLVTIKIIKH